MSSPLKLKMISVMAVPEHWQQFAAVARAQGLSKSSLFRQMVVREIHRAAKEAASGK
jgi:hypothetical protein